MFSVSANQRPINLPFTDKPRNRRSLGRLLIVEKSKLLYIKRLYTRLLVFRNPHRAGALAGSEGEVCVVGEVGAAAAVVTGGQVIEEVLCCWVE